MEFWLLQRGGPSQLSLSQPPREDFHVAVDYRQLTEDLRGFYDFTGRVVLFVGAGGRQLLDPSIETKKLIAIDRDIVGLREFRRNHADRGGGESVQVVDGEFEDVNLCGDVVYFEFCLHEMLDPQRALAHARTLAPDVVVFDHLPGSDWVYYAAEEKAVRRSAEAMKHFGIRRRREFHNEQRFQDHAELLAKIAAQGPVAIERAQYFA